MQEFNPEDLRKLYIPPHDSHKGQNGKLMIIGGSHLFHSALLWSLEIASKIVDMVFYVSVPENQKIVLDAKESFRNGIIVPREQVEDYIDEADCVLIGPGMVRSDKSEIRNPKSETNANVQNLNDINKLEDEGEQTYWLTKYLLEKYPEKKWVIDAGALQMLEMDDLKRLNGNAIITPHRIEFQRVFQSGITNNELGITKQSVEQRLDTVLQMAKEYNIIILLKAEQDIICSPDDCVVVSGGNAGMTKGGTGDVLAGLTAALACNNDLFLAAKAASYINKKAGESLFEKVGYYFNASDLVQEIPKVLKELLI